MRITDYEDAYDTETPAAVDAIAMAEASVERMIDDGAAIVIADVASIFSRLTACLTRRSSIISKTREDCTGERGNYQ